MIGRRSIAILTGGADKPYALGLGAALIAAQVDFDVIGGDELDTPAFHAPGVRFLNLRGDQRSGVSVFAKIIRVAAYYARLIQYAATSKATLFHILWNNKFEAFDRTVLMLYYKALRKKIVLTAHNVNAGKRDGNDGVWNRMTLRIQYRLADHIFVHTDDMRREMMQDFDIPKSRVSVIPFGINETVPNTSLTSSEARRQLGIDPGEKTLLFFGSIAPYKGLEYLVQALPLLKDASAYRLVIVGSPKAGFEAYWSEIRRLIDSDSSDARLLEKIEFVPDADTEVYFKAADILVLPYRYIFQSGVLFLAYNFGLPVLAADVGSLKDDVAEGRTGLVFRREDPADLARAIEQYFGSELYRELANQRQDIVQYAQQRHSWAEVARLTKQVYANVTCNRNALDAASRGLHSSAQ